MFVLPWLSHHIGFCSQERVLLIPKQLPLLQLSPPYPAISKVWKWGKRDCPCFISLFNVPFKKWDCSLKLPPSSAAVIVHVHPMNIHCKEAQNCHHWFRLMETPRFPPGAGVALSLLLNWLPRDTWTKLRFCGKAETREGYWVDRHRTCDFRWSW